MKITEYAAKAHDGNIITLSCDDNFTLQIHSGRERIESTPQMLADQIAPESLLKIAKQGGQAGQKAAEALRIWIAANFD
jgi:hypothetical protein